MGTRADFYVGRGPDAEWIGSIAWDGHAGGKRTNPVFRCGSEQEFRAAVAKLSEADDFTRPEFGWPWPWDNSRTTDYAYAFDADRVYASCFGTSWLDAAGHKALQVAFEAYHKAEEPEGPEPEWPEQPAAAFPDMKDRKAVTFGKRGGVLVVAS